MAQVHEEGQPFRVDLLYRLDLLNAGLLAAHHGLLPNADPLFVAHHVHPCSLLIHNLLL